MKGTVITFRVKEEEKERLQAVAKEQDISVSELIVGKHRSGANGTIELLFEKNISNFRNYIKNVQEN